MIKKVLTCAAVAAAAVALGAGSAAAHESGDDHRDRIVAAEWGGGSFEALKTSSNTGIFSGSKHYGAFVSVAD
ncbi:hypothetical protein QWM81_23385 [Streptomyces ficellus]|uniref:Uncharacterized protein n=1 Tax=Streptomyces ficellus TaxID=1977088 RepID=A0ABT7ZBW1_9ACTN|nr:hypothetical protein [Streptomyces ficellus]MDN3296935.1 hypothetical protein [Streptomyces ficellus]